MNMCVFGAVALGPFIGGVQAAAHAWRPLFWIVAAIALMALVLAALTFDDAPPADLDAPRDLWAIGLAAVGCAAAFVGASQLTSHGLTDAAVTAPMMGGLALIVVLVVYQFRARRPLLTIRTVLTSSIPVGGVGSGDRADGQRVVADRQPRPRRAALPSRTRRRRGDGGRVRDRHYPTHDALPSPRRHGAPRGRNRSFPHRYSGPPATCSARLSTDGPCTRRHSRTRAVRRGLLAAVQQPPARLRHHRAFAGGGRVHGRAGPCPFRSDRVYRPHFRYRLRALDWCRARDRRRRLRCDHLRTERSPTTAPRPGPVPRRRIPRLVLAAATGPNPVRPAVPGCRGRECAKLPDIESP